MMSVLTTIGLIVIGVLLFELIIFFHEGGHFIAAKKSGVQVNEFALGMGPKLFSFKKGETTYSLRAFPIGGFCSMEGEDQDSDNPRAFNNAKIWKRMIIIVAGAFMNILLGFIMMFVIVVQNPVYSSTTVDAFPQNSFSANCGLRAGDKIVRLNNYNINTSQDLSFAIATTKCIDAEGDSLEIYKQDCALMLCDLYGDLVYDKKAKYSDKALNKEFDLLNEGTDKIHKCSSKSQAKNIADEYYARMEKTVNVKKYTIPQITVKETRKRYQTDVDVIRNNERITLKNVQFYTYITTDKPDEPQVSLDFYVKPIEKNLGSVLEQTGSQTVSVVRMVWSSIGGLITGQFSFKEISGPVGAASAVTKVASESLQNNGFGEAVNSILYMMMLITVNLGIFNMLPFPALDGGRFVLLIIEGLFHKPIPRKVESIINGVGLGILLVFMFIITVKDVWQLLPFSNGG